MLAGRRLDDLGTERFSWRELKVIVTRTPPDRSALALERNPDDAGWSLTDHLLAEAVDALRLLLWAKTKDGEKNRNRPVPVERPGRRPEKSTKKPINIDEMRERLGW
jgi:hypothetical protein